MLIGTLHLGGQQITARGLEKKKGMSGLSALKPSNKSIEHGPAPCGRDSPQEEPQHQPLTPKGKKRLQG